MSRTRDLLVAGARAAGLDVPEDAIIVRTHVGHWQRAAGAWLWTLDYERWPRDRRGYRRVEPHESPYEERWRALPTIGSGWRASALVRCSHLLFEPQPLAPEVAVEPCRDCMPRVLGAQERQ